MITYDLYLYPLFLQFSHGRLRFILFKTNMCKMTTEILTLKCSCILAVKELSWLPANVKNCQIQSQPQPKKERMNLIDPTVHVLGMAGIKRGN